ncbi:MAG: chorismate mutase [bacterium]
MQNNEQNIEQYRYEIDETDKQIIFYLNKRKEISEKLINLKLAQGQEVFNPEREKEIINKLYSDQNNKLPLGIIRKIYQEIFHSSKSGFIE